MRVNTSQTRADCGADDRAQISADNTSNSSADTSNPMAGLPATFAACLAVLLAGLVALFMATSGATAFTTETLRRSQVAQAPAAIPDFRLVDAQGQQQSLHTLLAQDGRVWIVDFIYTRCPSLCLTLGSVFQQLQAQLVDRGLQQQVGLLSISFDPANDRPAELRAYARRMQMRPEVWHLVSLHDAADRRRLLDSFGIMVVPAPLGEFEHNAALHIVRPDGRLVRILDLSQPDAAIAAAVAAAISGPISARISARISATSAAATTPLQAASATRLEAASAFPLQTAAMLPR